METRKGDFQDFVNENLNFLDMIFSFQDFPEKILIQNKQS